MLILLDFYLKQLPILGKWTSSTELEGLYGPNFPFYCSETEVKGHCMICLRFWTGKGKMTVYYQMKNNYWREKTEGIETKVRDTV